MNRVFLGVFFHLFLFSAVLVPGVFAQDFFPGQDLNLQFKPDEFFVGTILAVEDAGSEEVLGALRYFKRFKILISGVGEAEIVEEDRFLKNPQDDFRVGDKVILRRQWIDENEFEYLIEDRYRLNTLWYLFGFFALLVLFISGKRGAGALAGLGLSILAIAYFTLPRLLAGGSVLFTVIASGLCIAATTIFLAHGFNKKSLVATLSTGITLAFASIISIFSVKAADLLGLGSEEAFYLSIGTFGSLDMQGLLLSGIIIGMLGVLDDVTTTQVAAVFEIQAANQKLKARELFVRGFSVGKEHISSLVNTLVLAYSGAGLPLFLLFKLEGASPAWVIFNSEFLAEEVVRALCGSIALVLAVPIATWLAAYAFRAR